MRVLYDLKAALDGYAGIPQETRLLFWGLRLLGPPIEVDGLLQHEHQTLVGAPAGAELTPDARVDYGSRSLVSFYPRPLGGRLHRYARKLQQMRQLEALRWQALRRRPIQLADFDGGRFGDFVWTRLFDKTLEIQAKPLVTAGGFRIAPPPRGMMQRVGLGPALPLARRRYLSLDTRGYDVLLTQTPFPGHVAPGTRLMVRYHDAVPLLMAHTIGAKAFQRTSHFQSLKANVEDGAVFACISEATRQDLLAVFPALEDRTPVIHNIVANHFRTVAAAPDVVRSVIASRARPIGGTGFPAPRDVPASYLLMVSTLEPRKNHELVIAAWERVRLVAHPDLALVLVGSEGWDFEPIIERIRPWVERRRLFHLSAVPAEELRILYGHAGATLCPSRAEGFDYSGIEAMASGGTVIASDIPVHREIYGDAALYFDPYSVEELSAAMARMLGDGGDATREHLRHAAASVVNRYRPEALVRKWEAALARYAGK